MNARIASWIDAKAHAVADRMEAKRLKTTAYRKLPVDREKTARNIRYAITIQILMLGVAFAGTPALVMCVASDSGMDPVEILRLFSPSEAFHLAFIVWFLQFFIWSLALSDGLIVRREAGIQATQGAE